MSSSGGRFSHNHASTVVFAAPFAGSKQHYWDRGPLVSFVRSLALETDWVITNAELLYGSDIYSDVNNALGVSRLMLNNFAEGKWGLRPINRHRIGIVLDKGIESELQVRELRAVDAMRATLGADIAGYIVSDKPLHDGRLDAADANQVAQPAALLRAVERLIQRAKITAVAVVSRFDDDCGLRDLARYHGRGYAGNPLVLFEERLKSLVTDTFAIPAAHAPALWPDAWDGHYRRFDRDRMLAHGATTRDHGSPYSQLASVVLGLARTPNIVEPRQQRPRPPYYRAIPQVRHGDLFQSDVDCLVVQAGANVGDAILRFADHPFARIISVDNRDEHLNMPPDDKATDRQLHAMGVRVLRAHSYSDALALVRSQSAGLSPSSLTNTTAPLRNLGYL